MAGTSSPRSNVHARRVEPYGYHYAPRYQKSQESDTWCRIATGFGTAIGVGVGLLMTGALLLPSALTNSEDGKPNSVYLYVPVFSLVAGVLMIITSIGMIKMVISKKLEKEKVTPSMRSSRDNGSTVSITQPREDGPPSYETVVRCGPPLYSPEQFMAGQHCLIWPETKPELPPPEYSPEPPYSKDTA